eukprot:TRINITY_DN1728_c0_g1_i5.p1 TRINITY_DN1728_c0_g1~~TRINITY_DN1728_c0_g1_i5.p1  ORF type:complete len:500 (+),score=194.26 TRINITY_DN1728_c0_g1_i5:199-1500(+)
MEKDEEEEEVYMPKKKRQAFSSNNASNSARKKSRRKSSPRKVIQESLNEENDPEEMEEETPLKSSNGSKNSRKDKKPMRYKDDDEDFDEESPSYGEDSEEEFAPRSGGSSKSSGKFPPVSLMVKQSIKILKDPPKTGSSFSSIKDTMARNWSLNIKSHMGRIKRYMESAEKRGEIIRTKGKGFNARFTLAGMKKAKRKKKAQQGLGKEFDEDEVEYVPSKTQRDEERVKDQEELQRRREERAAELAKELEAKAARPKASKPKKEFFEVQSIQGAKERNGIHYYLVKYEGSSKPQWEPEENVQNCRDLVEMFLKEDELRKAEIAKLRQECEEKGEYEIQRIIEVHTNPKTGKRSFLIRWKGYSASDDSWENEEDLNCPELIEAFMDKVKVAKSLSQKSLRAAPKTIERLVLADSFRPGKNRRTGQLRMTYEDME